MTRHILITFLMIVMLTLTGCGTSDANSTKINVDNEPTSTTESINDKDASIKDDNEQADQVEETNNENNSTDDENEDSSSLKELTVHYIDVGQADATLFQYADENESYTILFDTGDWRQNDVVNYLADQDVSTIDLVATSHPHSDHIGQLAEIVNTYDVGEVWMSGNEASSKTFQNAVQAVIDSDADFYEPRTGDEFSIGPMDITVLYPDDVTGDLNEESVSLHMSYGDTDFVFTGDAEKAAESAMVQSGMILDADILQLGHHGSRTSSTPPFIGAVNPEVAIYSAAVDSQYGHPDPEIVERIQDADIDLYGTDVNGTIIVKTDGKGYEIMTQEDGTVTPKSTGSAETGATEQTESESESENDNKSQATDGCVDINNASIEDVQEIIHIGPTRAEDLIDLRPFSSIDDLERISGIGPARIDDIKADGATCVNE